MAGGGPPRALFLAIGVGLLGGAGWSWQQTSAFVASAARAEGTVVDYLWKSNSDGTSWRPIVEFRAADGSERRFTSELGNNPPSYEVGEKVVVLYRPEDPAQAEIGDFMSLWFVTTVLAVLGLAFSIGGAVTLRQGDGLGAERDA